MKFESKLNRILGKNTLAAKIVLMYGNTEDFTEDSSYKEYLLKL